MKYKGHFRIDQNKTVSKNISKSTLILHNNIKDYLIWIPANIKTKNRLTEEQQRKRGMFSDCVEEFPKDQLFWNSHFHKLPVSEHSKMLKSIMRNIF